MTKAQRGIGMSWALYVRIILCPTDTGFT